MKFRRGITLIELIITVSTVTVIGSLALVSFLNARNSRDLTASTQNILSVLRLAQEKSLGGEGNSVWGVHLEQNRFVLFQGPSWASAATTTVHNLPSRIEIANIGLTGGGSDVIFKRLTGETSQSGGFDVRVAGSVTQIANIRIDASGKAYQNIPAPATLNTRLVDTRHRSFILGWSIKNSTTLTLTFSDSPNPDTTVPVAMASYFTSDRTKFDWSDSVPVGGVNQVLRIHTTSLTDTNTTLSIDRDCRRNTKKVVIAIDGQTIATYEANCATVTVGPFGGVISEP